MKHIVLSIMMLMAVAQGMRAIAPDAGVPVGRYGIPSAETGICMDCACTAKQAKQTSKLHVAQTAVPKKSFSKLSAAGVAGSLYVIWNELLLIGRVTNRNRELVNWRQKSIFAAVVAGIACYRDLYR